MGNTDSPYVIQLDCDDTFYPNTIGVLVREAETQPQNVAVFCGNFLYYYKENGQPMGIIEKGYSYKNKYDFLLADCTLRPRLYRTSVLKQIGGWPTDDPYEGRYVEDRRILTRIIAQYQFHWVDKILYRYNSHASCMSIRKKEESEEMIKWIHSDALKRWGDHYEPIYQKSDDGWIGLVKLVPKNGAQSEQRNVLYPLHKPRRKRAKKSLYR